MEPWMLVLDEAAFHFFNGLRAAERRKVLYALDQIKRDPQQKCHFAMADASGRRLSGRFSLLTGAMISRWKSVWSTSSMFVDESFLLLQLDSWNQKEQTRLTGRLNKGGQSAGGQTAGI